MSTNLLEQLPNSFDAENAVIAALLIENDLYDKISDFLHYIHFFDPLNRKIFKAITELIQKNTVANKVTIWPMFSNEKILIERGGEDYFNSLCQSVISVAHIYDYARQVFDLHVRREAIKILTKNLAKCYTFAPNENAFNYIENTESELFSLSKLGQTDASMSPFSSLLSGVMHTVKEAKKSGNKIVGISTGFIDLDRHLGGFHKSDLLILAGRPSMGKTALGATMGFYAAKSYGASVAFFSLEMSATQLATRILGQEAIISPDKIRRGMLSSDEIDVLDQEQKRLSNTPFFIIDTPTMTVAGIRTYARRLVKEQEVGLIIIDYLQLIISSGKTENRALELSEITRGLKAIARELNIPILVLSQLSRAVEQREDKRPQLADLRESGGIEEHADVVMMVYRESYYETRKKPPEGSDKMKHWQDKMSQIHNIAELMIVKQRHGPIKNITLHYEDSLAKFGNYIESVKFHHEEY